MPAFLAALSPCGVSSITMIFREAMKEYKAALDTPKIFALEA